MDKNSNDKIRQAYLGLFTESAFEDKYNYIDGTRLTKNSFFTAKDTNGNVCLFTDATGKTEPIMIGVTTYGIKDMTGLDYPLIENEVKGRRVDKPENARTIIWLPNKYDNGCGMAINFAKYLAAVENPEQYPDEIAKLEAIGVPLNIDTKME